MDPAPRAPATLVDLLDRVLDRGLVINADIIICLAGVPLIGLNLRAALAGVETMARHGVMTEWDRSIRARIRAPEAMAPALAPAAAGNPQARSARSGG
ncbi:MAG: gas vesicle protein [Chloroflexi bacterium]|nr:gas vesicle protein [Chloroflexota bacterium]